MTFQVRSGGGWGGGLKHIYSTFFIQETVRREKLLEIWFITKTTFTGRYMLVKVCWLQANMDYGIDYGFDYNKKTTPTQYPDIQGQLKMWNTLPTFL